MQDGASATPQAGSRSIEGQIGRAWASAFEGMDAAFMQATRIAQDSLSESHHIFAGRRALMRVIGPKLAEQIRRPFAHLLTDGLPATPDLMIDLWDQAETGIACPPASERDLPGSNRMLDDGLMTASPEGRFVRLQLPGSLTWLDRMTGRIIGWRLDGGRLSIYERNKPFRSVLAVYYNDQSVQIIHAGLVSLKCRGVLIGGSSAAGKSTTALACLCGGFDYLGDDATGLQESNGSLLGHSIYSSARLRPAQLERFPMLSGHGIPSDDPLEEKSLVLLADVFPARLERVVPIQAVALPRVVDSSESRLRPASKGQALLSLAPSSLLVSLRPGPRAMDRLAHLVQDVPAYWLELGRDLSQIPERVHEILTKADHSGRPG
jgi:hypothetical protein